MCQLFVISDVTCLLWFHAAKGTFAAIASCEGLKKIKITGLKSRFPSSLQKSTDRAQCKILPQNGPFRFRFLRRNWRVIFLVFQSNFGFGELNSSVRCLVWENERKNWEIFLSSLRSPISKNEQFSQDFPTLCEITAQKVETVLQKQFYLPNFLTSPRSAFCIIMIIAWVEFCSDANHAPSTSHWRGENRVTWWTWDNRSTQ